MMEYDDRKLDLRVAAWPIFRKAIHKLGFKPILVALNLDYM
jgi:hypothetical protein